MTENENTAEQPPKQKMSFVSQEDYPSEKEQQKMAQAPKNNPVTLVKVGDKEILLLKPDIALTLIYGKLEAVLTELKTLNDIFSKAAQPKAEFKPAPQPTQISTPVKEPAKPIAASTITPTTSPTQATQGPPATEVPPRVKEIIAAFEPLAEYVLINTDESAMFVIVRPSKFLGSEIFAKVATTVRGLGGQYVSAGKNSHFEIPKAPLKK
jgi:hypothetical protein